MKALFHLVRVAEANKGFPEIEVLFNYSGQFTDCEWVLSQDDLPSHFSTLVGFLAAGYSEEA